MTQVMQGINSFGVVCESAVAPIVDSRNFKSDDIGSVGFDIDTVLAHGFSRQDLDELDELCSSVLPCNLSTDENANLNSPVLLSTSDTDDTDSFKELNIIVIDPELPDVIFETDDSEESKTTDIVTELQTFEINYSDLSNLFDNPSTDICATTNNGSDSCNSNDEEKDVLLLCEEESATSSETNQKDNADNDSTEREVKRVKKSKNTQKLDAQVLHWNEIEHSTPLFWSSIADKVKTNRRGKSNSTTSTESSEQAETVKKNSPKPPVSDLVKDLPKKTVQNQRNRSKQKGSEKKKSAKRKSSVSTDSIDVTTRVRLDRNQILKNVNDYLFPKKHASESGQLQENSCDSDSSCSLATKLPNDSDSSSSLTSKENDSNSSYLTTSKINSSDSNSLNSNHSQLSTSHDLSYDLFINSLASYKLLNESHSTTLTSKLSFDSESSDSSTTCNLTKKYKANVSTSVKALNPSKCKVLPKNKELNGSDTDNSDRLSNVSDSTSSSLTVLNSDVKVKTEKQNLDSKPLLKVEEIPKPKKVISYNEYRARKQQCQKLPKTQDTCDTAELIQEPSEKNLESLNAETKLSSFCPSDLLINETVSNGERQESKQSAIQNAVPISELVCKVSDMKANATLDHKTVLPKFQLSTDLHNYETQEKSSGKLMTTMNPIQASESMVQKVSSRQPNLSKQRGELYRKDTEIKTENKNASYSLNANTTKGAYSPKDNLKIARNSIESFEYTECLSPKAFWKQPGLQTPWLGQNGNATEIKTEMNNASCSFYTNITKGAFSPKEELKIPMGPIESSEYSECTTPKALTQANPTKPCVELCRNDVKIKTEKNTGDSVYANITKEASLLRDKLKNTMGSIESSECMAPKTFLKQPNPPEQCAELHRNDTEIKTEKNTSGFLYTNIAKTIFSLTDKFNFRTVSTESPEHSKYMAPKDFSKHLNLPKQCVELYRNDTMVQTKENQNKTNYVYRNTGVSSHNVQLKPNNLEKVNNDLNSLSQDIKTPVRFSFPSLKMFTVDSTGEKDTTIGIPLQLNKKINYGIFKSSKNMIPVENSGPVPAVSHKISLEDINLNTKSSDLINKTLLQDNSQKNLTNSESSLSGETVREIPLNSEFVSGRKESRCLTLHKQEKNFVTSKKAPLSYFKGDWTDKLLLLDEVKTDRKKHHLTEHRAKENAKSSDLIHQSLPQIESQSSFANSKSSPSVETVTVRQLPLSCQPEFAKKESPSITLHIQERSSISYKKTPLLNCHNAKKINHKSCTLSASVKPHAIQTTEKCKQDMPKKYPLLPNQAQNCQTTDSDSGKSLNNQNISIKLNSRRKKSFSPQSFSSRSRSRSLTPDDEYRWRGKTSHHRKQSISSRSSTNSSSSYTSSDYHNSLLSSQRSSGRHRGQSHSESPRHTRSRRSRSRSHSPRKLSRREIAYSRSRSRSRSREHHRYSRSHRESHHTDLNSRKDRSTRSPSSARRSYDRSDNNRHSHDSLRSSKYRSDRYSKHNKRSLSPESRQRIYANYSRESHHTDLNSRKDPRESHHTDLNSRKDRSTRSPSSSRRSYDRSDNNRHSRDSLRSSKYRSDRYSKHNKHGLSPESRQRIYANYSRSYSPEQQMEFKERRLQIEERRVVYAGRIPDGWSEGDLRARFDCFGPIEQVSVHFRRGQDNFGFVTYKDKNDTNNAVERGNDDPLEPKLDISFGGRRAFCKRHYADLDKEQEDGTSRHSKAQEVDYDTLLKSAQRRARLI